jgi:hypothetical protein
MATIVMLPRMRAVSVYPRIIQHLDQRVEPAGFCLSALTLLVAVFVRLALT